MIWAFAVCFFLCFMFLICLCLIRGALLEAWRGFPGGLEHLPHTPAAHLIISSSFNTGPLSMADGWPASISLWILACIYFCYFSDRTWVFLDLSSAGIPPTTVLQTTLPPSLLHLYHQLPLHLGPSVPHSRISSETTADIAVSPTTQPADTQPETTPVSPPPASLLSRCRPHCEPRNSIC